MTSEDEKEKFDLMERRDEEQIQKAIMGEYLEEFIYDFTTKDGHRVTNLSWVGIKEIASKMGHIRCDEKPDIRDQGESWFVMVKAEDKLRDSSRWGVTTQSKKMKRRDGSIVEDEFALQKAMSKAQRNAIRQLIPEKWIQMLIDKFIHGERKFEPEKVIDVKVETEQARPQEQVSLGKVLKSPQAGSDDAYARLRPGPPKGGLSPNKMGELKMPERNPMIHQLLCTEQQEGEISELCRTYEREFGYDPLKDILREAKVQEIVKLTYEQAQVALKWLKVL